MNEPKWTPGPWEVGDDDHNGQAVVRGAHIEIATCWHHSVGSIEKEMRANARIIAAAPDLAEALEAYLAADGDTGNPNLSIAEYDKRMEQARLKALAALSKAKGPAT